MTAGEVGTKQAGGAAGAKHEPSNWVEVLASPEELRERHPFVGWAWGLLRLDYTGIAFAALFFCWSLTPSLLPRDWLYQGLIGGITAAIGYGVGTAVGWAVNRLLLARLPWWPPPAKVQLALKIAVPTLSLLVSIGMLIASAAWQRELAALTDAEGTTTTGYLRTLLLSMLVAALLISLWRVLRDLVRLVARYLNRWLKVPRSAAAPIGVVLVAFLSYTMVTDVLFDAAYAAINSAFSLQNNTTREGVEQPTALERSGSPDSYASWESLGFEGRNFVSRGMHADELTAVNGKQALEPIRVYAGLETAADTDARLDVVIAELERTGAFHRSVLVVIPTTGTGWVNPTAAEAIELVHNGDSALVANQYSYLPSWISFLADRNKAAEAGRALIGRVHERWLREPAETRPKLLIYGESLGTQAGEAAFDGLADIRETVDGVLWVGPPNSNTLWSQLEARRDPGTRQVEPMYSDGLVVRFANDAASIGSPASPWMKPRVLYIQHPSDPVVWWSPDLIFNRPDWLSEAPGDDRLPDMRWFPFVTFWQVAADLANAAGVPDGHGHNYGTTVLDGWVAVAAPDGWTADDTERVRAAIDARAGTQGPEK
ncbi:alpha/beta-hydrolase family protein [Rhodococcus maanshanensis]|uniref:alpha/beta hydrolase n=1 Tax=Rhodococcus maanshanensis TaxID=183556 RepID=UPI0022B33729|nr:alpha/beta-hydrolase family protein [Rhodococcus maanshanensis]MCZ4556352.1 alpha/beta-hydrolase family protein [Rhodococcus maanshanensis]